MAAEPGSCECFFASSAKRAGLLRASAASRSASSLVLTRMWLARRCSATANWAARASYAAALVDAQQRDSALGQLRLAVHDFPKARFALGTELAAEGRYDEAVRELSAFIVTEPRASDRFRARMLRGRLLLEQQRFDAAVAEYDALVQRRPSAVEPRLRLAHALASSGRRQDAVASYRAALDLDPRSHAAHMGLAELLLKAGAVREGVVHAEAAVALNPASATAHNILGIALAMNGRLEEAVAHFRDSVAIDPRYTEAVNNLARAEQQLAASAGGAPRP